MLDFVLIVRCDSVLDSGGKKTIVRSSLVLSSIKSYPENLNDPFVSKLKRNCLWMNVESEKLLTSSSIKRVSGSSFESP